MACTLYLIIKGQCFTEITMSTITLYGLVHVDLIGGNTLVDRSDPFYIRLEIFLRG